MDLEKAISMKGILGKESPSMFKGYQNRFFQIIKDDTNNVGYLLIYSEKEDSEAKGSILLAQISDAKSCSKKEFSFKLGERQFKLKAKDETNKNNWIEAINFLKNESIKEKKEIFSNGKNKNYIDYSDYSFNISNDNPININNNNADVSDFYYNRDRSISTGSNESQSKNSISSENNKSWKIKNQTKKVVDAISNKGININKEHELSEKLLEITGIKEIIKNLSSYKNIKSRIKYGFLSKKQQKRWFFLLSNRPLSIKDQIDDDETLEEDKYLPNSKLKFNTLYYFKPNTTSNEFLSNISEDNDELAEKGFLTLKNCSEIKSKESDKEFYIIIDMNDKIYELCSLIGWERDAWYEALINSRKTAIDIDNSKTKKPRNIIALAELYNNTSNGVAKIEKIVDNEILNMIKDFLEIKDNDALCFILKKLRNKLSETLDGCIVYDPPQIEIMKIYANKYNNSMLQRVQSYWKHLCNNLTTNQILELADLLIKEGEELSNNYGVIDPNFLINALELIKIFTRKSMISIKPIILKILKDEREYKAIKSENEDDANLLITYGPKDVFTTISTLHQIIKKFRFREIYEEVIKMFREVITIYLIGVNAVIKKGDFNIDNEYLIAVCNNSIQLFTNIDELVDDIEEDIKQNKINLSKKDIEYLIGCKEIKKSINFLAQSAMARLVFELAGGVQKLFDKAIFYEIDINLINRNVIDVYETFEIFMHFSTKRKYWSEVLRSLVISYIKVMLLTANDKKTKNKNNIENLILKIKEDKDKFKSSFDMLGEFQFNENVVLLDSILEFLTTNLDMLSFACANIKAKIEHAFNINTAKALINLRSDFKEIEKKEALLTCKDYLETYDKKNNKKAYHDEIMIQLERELKTQMDEDNANEANYKQQEKHLKDINYKEDKKETSFVLDIDDFLECDEDEESNIPISEKNSVLNSSDKKPINCSISAEDKLNILEKDIQSQISTASIVKEGYMLKKSSNKWQERYFQIKNSKLYWYLDINSTKANNYIDISTIQSYPFIHKENKFTIISNNNKSTYKFECKSNDECEEWIKAIKSEMKKLSNKNDDQLKKNEIIFQLDLKKKFINLLKDEKELPNVYSHKANIKDAVFNEIKKEKFFSQKEIKKEKIKGKIKDKTPIDIGFDLPKPSCDISYEIKNANNNNNNINNLNSTASILNKENPNSINAIFTSCSNDNSKLEKLNVSQNKVEFKIKKGCFFSCLDKIKSLFK